MPKFYGRVEKVEEFWITAKSAVEAKAIMRKIVNGDEAHGDAVLTRDADEVERWELCRTDGRGDPTEVIDGEGTRVQQWDVDVFGKPLQRHIP